MKQYLDAVWDVLKTGQQAENRTGIDTIFKHGLYLKFDMADGFPAVTTKELNWRSCFAEMLGFWRGLDNAQGFRALGTNVWNANADAWEDSDNCRCIGDLGRIYGVQARNWVSPNYALYGAERERRWPENGSYLRRDQLRKVYEHLHANIDDRREIVTHWNPGELGQMALPPCHLFYQFGLRQIKPNISNPLDASELDLFVYIRSNDMGLGMPFNIAGYAWLLHVMARIANKIPGTLHYFAWNYHIYVNHIETLREQITRKPKDLPDLYISPDVQTLEDVDDKAVLRDFALHNYCHHPKLAMKMAI